jgi:hypothetical protein
VPFHDAPPANLPLDAAHRERRGIGPRRGAVFPRIKNNGPKRGVLDATAAVRLRKPVSRDHRTAATQRPRCPAKRGGYRGARPAPLPIPKPAVASGAVYVMLAREQAYN